MTIDAEFLLSRLPAFYRQRDAEQGGSLRALLTVIAEQGALLEADINIIRVRELSEIFSLQLFRGIPKDV